MHTQKTIYLSEDCTLRNDGAVLNGKGNILWPVVGAKCILVKDSHERGGTDYRIVNLQDAPDGIPGNMNKYICRFHGWRGTSYGWQLDALGVRKIKKIRVVNRRIAGYGWTVPTVAVTVGADLYPDLE